MKHNRRSLRYFVSVIAVSITLLAPATVSAQDHEPGEGCDEETASNLVVTAVNPANPGPKVTVAVHTSKNGVIKGNVLFDDGTYRLHDMDIHRVILRGAHDGHETLDGHDDGDHEGALGVGIRGLAVLDNGDLVRAQIDLWEPRSDHTQNARIRWRPYDGEDPHGEDGHSGECGQHNWYGNQWTTIQRVDIHQRQPGR